MTLPLVWAALPHGGNSDSAVRMRLVARLLRHLPARRWKALVADREFIGQQWFTFLRQRRIPRCIRLRENTRLDDDFVRDAFQKLERGQVRGLFERAWVYGSLMQVVATLSPEGSVMHGCLSSFVFDAPAEKNGVEAFQTSANDLKTGLP